MKKFQILFTLALSLLVGACDKNSNPVTPKLPDVTLLDGGEKNNKPVETSTPTPVSEEAPPAIAQPSESTSRLVGTWEFLEIWPDNNPRKRFPVSGSWTFNEDMSFVKEVTVAGSQADLAKGSYALDLDNDKLILMFEGLSPRSVPYEIGQTDIGVPGLYIFDRLITYVLTKRQE